MLSLTTVAVTAQAEPKRIDFNAITKIARELAARPFAPKRSELPEELRNLNYDTYREIRFQHDRALWKKEELPFRVEFFHPGYLYQTPVFIHEFTATHAQPIRFVQDFFDYGQRKVKVPADTGYAGFKLLYQLNQPQRWDELAAFLGASYFRCLGQGQTYGASARGLALNSGEPDLPEEFPVFTQWWLGKPDKESNTVRLYALLESASCTGAYDFLLKPGVNTVVDVDAELFFREGAAALKTIGIAPLTSMFWFGENSEPKPNDYRPEVHDSDGLGIRFENDEFHWLPLNNPPAPQHRSIRATAIRGFGLLQRDRQLASYEDLFNPYHKVSSIWVEPRGHWGAGEVRLVELPTQSEAADNIVAFWNPAARPKPLEPFRVAYTLHWSADVKLPEARLARVAQTRSGVPQRDHTLRQFVVDFSAAPLSAGATPTAEVLCANDIPVSDIQVIPNELSQGWRVFFSIKPDSAKPGPVEVQCSLKAGNKTISEIWKYLWQPSHPK